MRVSWNRGLSGIVAVSCVMTLALHGDCAGAVLALGFLAIPMACIWFADSIASLVGPVWGGNITSASHEIAVCSAGWILLLIPALIAPCSAIF